MPSCEETALQLRSFFRDHILKNYLSKEINFEINSSSLSSPSEAEVIGDTMGRFVEVAVVAVYYSISNFLQTPSCRTLMPQPQRHSSKHLKPSEIYQQMSLLVCYAEKRRESAIHSDPN